MPPAEQLSSLYFAYGSNLHLNQMKRRCPHSRLIGRAILDDYRWHINQRGYANIIEAKGRHIDGLVYEIGDKGDRDRLDRNEGVADNAYTKHYLKVDLYPANSALYRRPVAWIVDQGGPSEVTDQATRGGLNVVTESGGPIEQTVLVYISFSFVTDSRPKEEYIFRINDGMADAKSLGMPQSYIQDSVRPFVPAVRRR